MASLGSLSFLIQMSSCSCSSLRRRRRRTSWKKPHLVAICGRNGVDSSGDGAVSKMGSFGASKGEIFRRGILRAAAATGNSEGTEVEGEGETEDGGDVADNALRATIKRSKEVLARQKDLLQQVPLKLHSQNFLFVLIYLFDLFIIWLNMQLTIE